MQAPYDDWIASVIDRFDRAGESFDQAIEDFSFRAAWKAGRTPTEAFNDWVAEQFEADCDSKAAVDFEERAYGRD